MYIYIDPSPSSMSLFIKKNNLPGSPTQYISTWLPFPRTHTETPPNCHTTWPLPSLVCALSPWKKKSANKVEEKWILGRKPVELAMGCIQEAQNFTLGKKEKLNLELGLKWVWCLFLHPLRVHLHQGPHAWDKTVTPSATWLPQIAQNVCIST